MLRGWFRLTGIFELAKIFRLDLLGLLFDQTMVPTLSDNLCHLRATCQTGFRTRRRLAPGV